MNVEMIIDNNKGIIHQEVIWNNEPKMHQMGLSLDAILHQDSGAKIQTKIYLSKYP